MTTMEAALTALDRAFGRRTGRTRPIEGCSHCFSAEELRRLSGPLDAIPDSELFHAVFSWGSTLDDSVPWLRWIAPRLLRAVAEGGSALDPEMVGCRLYAARWRDWPEAEAIRVFCETLWREALSDAEGAPRLELCFLVPLTDTVEPWLAIWSQTSGAVADQHFRELWQAWGTAILAGRLDVCCYREGPNIAPVLRDWVLAESGHRALQ
ncbi:hypothetical protein ACFVMC_27010 [Nocardia sp. NPDC127579]|uniref:hypothetical protein n=1 Tax=Nocardia sp. NPDC127579 TaxID=3345402 RepID=UPI00363DC37F